MFDKLKSILSKLDADYADIRYEDKKDTIVSFSGKELTEIGANSADGFVIRALKDGGMASVVGRVRECPVLDYKFVLLGHNTIRGAAGAAILNAELLKAKGYL